MKKFAWMVIGAVAMTASASYARDPFFEDADSGRGSLAVSAIERGDWKAAETLLAAGNDATAQDDPARLINLGRVYMATGRPGMALSAWRVAATSTHPYQVRTGDGHMVWSSNLAEQLIARYEPALKATASN